MSQISATDDLRLRIRQRLEAAQHAAGADPLRMAIRQRLAAMQPQQPQPFSAGDPLGQERPAHSGPPSRHARSLASLLPRPSLASVDWRHDRAGAHAG